MQRNIYTTHINILPDFNFLIINSKDKMFFYHIYIYDEFFFYKIDKLFNPINMCVDKETNTIIYQHRNKIDCTNKFKNSFRCFLFTLNNYYFEKIKFAGKGYRVVLKKRRKRMKFKFGHSHKKLIFFKNIKIKKYHKYKFTLISNNVKSVIKTAIMVCNVKLINLYTKRGIRRSRQIVFWKKSQKLTN